MNPMQFIKNSYLLIKSASRLPSTLVAAGQGETPHARTMVKTLKLAIYLFLDF
jgi:hypothetical protein